MNTLIAYLTTKCNYRCKHCMRDFSKARDLDPEILEKALIGSKKYGINSICLTGGEPILHSNFEDVLNIIKRHGFTYSIVTNGLAIGSYLKFFVKFPNISAVSLSIESADEKTNDKMRMNGSYKTIQKAIEICREHKIPFVIATTVGKPNLNDVESLIRFAIQNGASCVVLSTVLTNPNASSNDLVLSWEEREKLFYRINELIIKYPQIPIYPGSPLGSNVPNSRLCGVMELGFITVDVDGNINFCCNLADYSTKNGACKETVIASLKEDSFEEAIEKYKIRIENFLKERPKDYDQIEGGQINYNSCFYCLKRFGLG